MAGNNKNTVVVTLERKGVTANGELKNCIRIYSIAGEEKQRADVANSSEFIEMDTGKIYFYVAATNSWVAFMDS